MEQHIPTFTMGERLRKARESAGVSEQEMAALLEVTDRTIRNYESDARPIKRPSLVVWSIRTGVPVEWITGDTGEQGERLSRCTGASRLAA